MRFERTHALLQITILVGSWFPSKPVCILWSLRLYYSRLTLPGRKSKADTERGKDTITLRCSLCGTDCVRTWVANMT